MARAHAGADAVALASTAVVGQDVNGLLQRINHQNVIGGKIRTLTYSGLTVTAWDGKVYLISATKPKFVTIDGVKVGDNSQKVVKTYGYGSQSVQGGVTRLTYSNDQKASNLIVEIKGDRVQKILVSTQLN